MPRPRLRRAPPSSSSADGIGAGGFLLLLGSTVAIYALSPGARHWYKYGRLPFHRR